VVRHEIIALQFADKGTPEDAGTTNRGAQFYPICANIEVIGSGTVVAPGVKFPGGYSPREPGILKDIYSGKSFYTTTIGVTKAPNHRRKLIHSTRASALRWPLRRAYWPTPCRH
jgi:hypothetical protein